MVRKLVVAFTSVVLFAAAHVKALGLGEIVVESALNQPLAARIELVQLGGVRPDQISVQLASENDFARFSIDRESFLDSIRFSVEPEGSDAYVHLTTAGAVREPYLSFVLETSWPSGRLLSEHTVLLDLPSFASSGQSAPIQQPTQSQAQAQLPQTDSVNNQSTGVSSSRDLSSAAARLAAPAGEPNAPDAMPGTDSAAQLIEVEEPTPAPAPDIVAAPAPEAPAPQSNPDPALSPLATSSETISIGEDDTLWDIALQVRPDSSVSVQQTMLALQQLNREAFIADNINMVRRGQVLRVPGIDEIRALSARDAISEVSRQNQLFENRSNVPLTSQPVTTQPSAVPADTPTRRGELTVVTTDSADATTAQPTSGGRSAELDARIANLENELAVQLEEADRVALQNQELTERLGMLEEQIASAQQIIRLRDMELAQLQQSLAAAAAEEIAAPAPVDPPTVITMAPERTLVQTVLDTLIANTYALLAVTALIILMLVYVLLRRNRSAEEDPAEMEAMEDDPAKRGSASAVHSEFATRRASDSSIAGDDSDLDEIFNLADEVDEVLVTGDAGSPDAEEAAAVGELLEEIDALIAHRHYDEATTLLQDAIVAEPHRTDLRLKLLEVCVARQDAIGFKLQETELRDLGGVGVAARIADLRSQLRGAVDDEILEEGEEDFFRELSSLDDMEVALDLEATADVDDDRVLAGYSAPDSVEETVEIMAPREEGDPQPVDFDFDLSDPEAAPVQPFREDQGDEDLNLLDFDSVEESVSSTSAVSLADNGSEEQGAAREELGEDNTEAEREENLLDFDFDFSLNDEPEAAEIESESVTPDDTESDPEHSVDFDFTVLDVDDNTARAAPDSFNFADNDFDLDVVESEEPESASSTIGAPRALHEDDLADLRFVDDSALDEASELNAAFADDSLDDDEFEFLADADEAATKLDLAQAYYEMGDYDGAREILEEVIAEGTEAQIRDARTLLEKL